MRRLGALAAFCLVAALGAPAAHAQEVPLDRVVVRFVAPETGGVRSPRFIFERGLALEARLEALSDPDRSKADEAPYLERHIRAALERHVAETLLAALRIDPEPTAKELARQTEAARLLLYQQAGGALAVQQAAVAEGMDAREILRILRRRARASLYLDRMVAPMLVPSRAELQALHRTTQTPFRDRRFDEIEPALRRWYVGQRLAQALGSFYQNARSRLEVKIVK